MGNISVGQRLGDLKADLMIEVVTQDGNGDLVRGFRAVEMLIDICRKLSSALLPGVPLSLRPIVVLEDIDARSVIAWLRQEQSQGPSGRDGANEYAIGGIVESAKWLSNCRGGADFQQLLRSLDQLLRKGPRLPVPDSAKLLAALCELQDARESLAAQDQVLFVAEAGSVLLDRSSLVPARHLLRSSARWHLRNDATEMLLVVRQPDYSGGTVWTAQHNESVVEVSIDDRTWLDAFKNREIDVRDGDILRVIAATEHYYGADGTLLAREIRIITVHETIDPSCTPATLAQTAPIEGDSTPNFVASASPRNISLSFPSPVEAT